MAVDLREARVGDRGIIAAFLDDCLHELGPRGSPRRRRRLAQLPLFDAYFSEPGRYPFLIWHTGTVVGFALIRDPVSTGLTWQVAEFYVVPDRRRVGIGREAIASIWRRFPGVWELRVDARNAAARRFWTICLESMAYETPEVREIEASDGNRLQFNFRVE